MSPRILIAVLITVVIMLVPLAFLLGRRQSPPPLPPAPAAVTAPVAETVPAAEGALAAPDATTPAVAPEKKGGDLFGDLVSAVGSRVAADARTVVSHAADDAAAQVAARLEESTARLQRELDQRLERGRGDAERAARKLADELDQRTAALTRATSEQNARLAEQVEATNKAGRASAEAIARTSADLRTLVANTLISFTGQADKAKARIQALGKEGKGRADRLIGKAGLALPGTAAQLSNELALTWQRCLDEIDGAHAALQKQTTAAHQRFSDAVTKAQTEAEQQRLKALTLVQGASDALREQVAGAQRELTDSIKRAESEASQRVDHTMGQAEPRTEPARTKGSK